jgi:hypothetical protein
MITHLKRELIQAVWKLMLDDEFKDAYKDGLVIKCADGIMRRIYPRIFCYSADYPEKQVSSLLVFISPLMSNRVMLSSIRFLARRGCPEDLVEKQYFDELGTTNDLKRREHVRIDDEAYHRRIEKARWWIFNKGRGPAATNVDELLGDKSEAPVRVSACVPILNTVLIPFRTLSQPFSLLGVCINFSSPTCSTSSNLGYGRRCSRTS